MTTTEQQVLESRKLVHECSKILTGNEPEVIGAALIDLVAMLVAGHHPSIREELMKLHIQGVWALIECNEKRILEPYGGVWPSTQ